MIVGAGCCSSRGRRSFTKRGGGCCSFFFFFLFNEWRAAATAAAGSAAWVVPSSQPARGGKGHLHATAGLGRNRQCDLEGGGRCGLGILGLEQGGGGHTSICVSLVASGDGEGEREDPLLGTFSFSRSVAPGDVGGRDLPASFAKN